jgi:hypothetical protein
LSIVNWVVVAVGGMGVAMATSPSLGAGSMTADWQATSIKIASSQM